MTWVSHTAVTGAVTYAITLDPKFAAAAALGAVLPDKVEFMLPFTKHRGNSHAIAIWVGLIAIAAMATGVAWTPEIQTGAYYAFAVFIGGLCHVLEDMCSVSGVPILPTLPGLPKGPVAKIPLYKTGSISEFIVAGVILAGCATLVVMRTEAAGTGAGNFPF